MTGSSDRRPSPALSPVQRRLLQVLLAEKQRDLPAALDDEPVAAAERPSRIPLALNQEGLWFLDQLQVQGANLSLPASVRMHGALDVSALERSLTEICRRHEILRTTFASDAGEPRQAVSPSFEIRTPVTDLSALPEQEREREARRLATASAHLRFDLARGPLVRAEVIRMDTNDHVLLLNLHHIIADGWSMGVLTRELDHLYSMFSSGRPSQLPDLTLQYADFALWQRRRLDGPNLERQVSFWRQQLLGAMPSVQPPTDRPRPKTPSFRGGHHPLALSEDLSASVRAVASRAAATPFVVLSAAFALLLHSYSGQTDVIIGSTFANRRHRAWEDLIGFFVNTLPVRYDLSGDPPFNELLARARKALLDVHEHQDLPLSKIVQHVQPERALDRNPLFQVVFDLLTPDQNPAVFGYGLASEVHQQVRIGDLRVSPMDIEGGEARFDMAVFLWDMPYGFSGTIEYNTDVYDRGTVARVASGYETLLRHAMADAAAPLSRLCAELRRSDQKSGARQAEEYNVRARRTLIATKRKIIAIAGPTDD